MAICSGDRVGDFMQRSLEVIPPKTTIMEAAVHMRERQIGSLLVESPDEEGRLSHKSGIMTETDLIRKALAKGIDPSRSAVDQIMTSPLLTISPDRPMLDASHLMETNHVRHLGVSDGKEILGLISVRDLVRYFVDSEGGPIRKLEKVLRRRSRRHRFEQYRGGPIRKLDNVFRPLSVLRVIMQTTMETIARERTVLEATQTMTEKRIGSLLVLEAGDIVGIVTETDVVRKMIAAGLPARNTRVGVLMNAPLIQIDIDDTACEASRLMAEKRIRHLAVTEDNKIVGLLSVRDLVKMVSVRDNPRFLHNT